MPIPRKRRLSHETHVQLLSLAGGLPAVLLAVVLLIIGDYSEKVQWTFGLVVVICWLWFGATVRERVTSPLRTMANLLEGVRIGDYSIRGRGARGDDALGEVLQQVNAMSSALRERRLSEMEATTLLRKVIEEIDIAIFAFDDQRCLRLVNRTGERLLAQPSQRVQGLAAANLGFDPLLEGDHERTLQHSFPGATGRWRVSRTSFRQEGRPHQLLVVTDLTRPLREEELQAWQRLVRVLGHELNNSLAPIKSIADSLSTLLRRKPRADDWEEDMTRGLQIVANRSEALARFIGAYARLAKLPTPRLGPIELEPWIRRVCVLETRLAVQVEPGPAMSISGDCDQLDQVLINLIRNATDASLETGGGVTVGWRRNGSSVVISVLDDGPGLASTANLFVPFFTTKPGGSGIGLVLSRQIAEAHDGSLTLTNRADRHGCEACLTLPI